MSEGDSCVRHSGFSRNNRFDVVILPITSPGNRFLVEHGMPIWDMSRFRFLTISERKLDKNIRAKWKWESRSHVLEVPKVEDCCSSYTIKPCPWNHQDMNGSTASCSVQVKGNDKLSKVRTFTCRQCHFSGANAGTSCTCATSCIWMLNVLVLRQLKQTLCCLSVDFLPPDTCCGMSQRLSLFFDISFLDWWEFNECV